MGDEPVWRPANFSQNKQRVTIAVPPFPWEREFGGAGLERNSKGSRFAPFPLGKGAGGIGRERNAKRIPAWHENRQCSRAIFVPRGRKWSGYFSFAHALSPSPPSLNRKGGQIIAFPKAFAGHPANAVSDATVRKKSLRLGHKLGSFRNFFQNKNPAPLDCRPELRRGPAIVDGSSIDESYLVPLPLDFRVGFATIAARTGVIIFPFRAIHQAESVQP